MNQSFNVSQLSVHRTYTPDVVELTLTDIAKRFVFIIDRGSIKDTINTLFKEPPNRKLEYRGFPYFEQIHDHLKDPESTGLLVVVKHPTDMFTEKHFNEHGDMYQTLSRKYRKPIVLHMQSENGGCEIFESFSDVVLQRQEVFGHLQVECVKNRLEERVRLS